MQPAEHLETDNPLDRMFQPRVPKGEQLEFDTSEIDRMNARFRRMREERERAEAERRKNNAPWWVPVLMLTGLGGLFAALVVWERRRRAVSQDRAVTVARHGVRVAAMILEEAEDQEIWRAFQSLKLRKSDAKAFLLGFDSVIMTTPIPWYRPDVPAWRAKIAERLV